MDPSDRATRREFAREHHLHYEVEPEETGDRAARELTGVRLRLLASHERARLEAPGCPACVALLDELRAFAGGIVADAGVEERAELIPSPRKLYQSPEERNVDEVALTIRVRCEAPEHRRPGGGPGGGEDRCLAAVRDRLAEIGVART
jgi:hypothetical protein